MAKAKIYQPVKNAMQSGMAKTRQWRLEFVPDTPYFVDNLMGWTGMRDTKRELSLSFPTRDAAIAYAERLRIPFEVVLPHKRSLVRKAYADNFKFDKPNG